MEPANASCNLRSCGFAKTARNECDVSRSCRRNSFTTLRIACPLAFSKQQWKISEVTRVWWVARASSELAKGADVSDHMDHNEEPEVEGHRLSQHNEHNEEPEVEGHHFDHAEHNEKPDVEG